ncbi:MAG: hypothetical protein AB1627_00335 [Chloroflexota bacterium]
MSEPVGDTHLRDMLARRAGRMPPEAGREVLAAVREAMRAPKGGIGFALLPVARAGRGSVAPAGWAVAALVAVIAFTVLGGRLGRGPAATGGTTDTPATDVPSGVPTASGPAGAVQRLSAARLALGIADGTLDGRLVLIDSDLDLVPQPCPSPSTAMSCAQPVIVGLEDVRVTWDRELVVSVDATSGAGTPPGLVRAGTLVATPHDGGLVLLGYLAGDVERPLPFADIVSQFLYSRADPLALHPVSGWLIDGVRGCLRTPDASPCPVLPPRITDLEPTDEGFLRSGTAVEVAVSNPASGLDPQQVVTPGPFLVRLGIGRSSCPPDDTTCGGAPTLGWTVVARYDAGATVLVEVP